MNTSNLFVFIIVLITAYLNKIPHKGRLEIYLRLNLFLKPDFRDYLQDRYKIDLEGFSTNSTEPNKFVCDVLKYIFSHNYNNAVENDLFGLTSRMFFDCENYSLISAQPKSKYYKSVRNAFITKDELKFSVAYWLLGNEDAISPVGGDLGSKYENFFYWIKQASFPNLNKYKKN